ncbi:MAG: hypothetical protein ABJF11_03495 [Reichenbachiella sp.]|uniref:carboxylesterase family protein n=1 Tax=Reichenbachiella sp. TaxID=2184521 RepID=UPI003262FCC2
MRYFKPLITLLIFSSFNAAHSQDIEKAVSMKAAGISYLLSTPVDYTSEQSYPTIIFLHGGDRSNTKHHPSKYAKKAGLEFPFIVIAPSCTSGCSWSNVDLKEILIHASAEVSIDRDRVYLIGYSMGGAGAWANLKKMHELLAAASPIAPAGGNISNLCKAKDLPIRVYHGTSDYGYQNSQKMVDALMKCGSSQAELISLDGQGHGIWPGIFSDGSFYSWLLQQSR